MNWTAFAIIAVIVVLRVGWGLWRRRQANAAPTSRPQRRFIKNRRWVVLRSLTVASTKMYFRNKSAVFFTLFLPLAFIGVFGLLSNSKGGQFTLDVTNQSKTGLSKQVVKALKDVDAFKVEEVPQSEGADRLGKGKTDLQVIIPESFGQVNPATHAIAPSKIITHYNEGKPQNGQAAGLILSQITSSMNRQLTNTPQIIGVESSAVKTNNLGSIDFILPGILAISIMQLGIFSVAFAFVSMKSTGMLRRIQATPTHPVNFVVAQAATRLLIGVLQVVLLTVLGIWLFNFHLLGNMFEFLVIAIMGTLVFLSFGFLVAGWAKDENQAAPIANLISFPMMFLSGTFFPRDAFPDWLRHVTDFFPLTFLADAFRQVANEGAHLTQIGTDVLGMVVWGVVMFFVAVKVFRWE
jgi:ABC-2 type transport system permease protein